MPSTTPLNNANLSEAILPATSYNALPLIADAKLDPSKHRAAHSKLLDLIKSKKLSDDFSIHLVHKHFDCPEGQVMVYEPVKGGKTSDFIIMTPRDPAAVKNLRGLYFMATPENTMVAYEYTNLPGKDLSAHEAFATEFAALANELGVAGIFCLSAEGVASEDYMQAEFEMAELKSTVVVHAEELPDLSQYNSVNTDWSPAKDGGVEDVGLDGFGGGASQMCVNDKDGWHKIETYKLGSETAVEDTGKVGDAVYPDVPGVITLKCVIDRVQNHNYHGKAARPPTEAAVEGTGKVGDAVYPDVPGIITLKCIVDRVKNHNYHGSAVRAEEGGMIETRQSIVGMSTGKGDHEITNTPSVWVAGQSVEQGSVIHDILGRAVAAIKGVEVC